MKGTAKKARKIYFFLSKNNNRGTQFDTNSIARGCSYKAVAVERLLKNERLMGDAGIEVSYRKGMLVARVPPLEIPEEVKDTNIVGSAAPKQKKSKKQIVYDFILENPGVAQDDAVESLLKLDVGRSTTLSYISQLSSSEKIVRISGGRGEPNILFSADFDGIPDDYEEWLSFCKEAEESEEAEAEEAEEAEAEEAEAEEAPSDPREMTEDQKREYYMSLDFSGMGNGTRKGESTEEGLNGSSPSKEELELMLGYHKSQVERLERAIANISEIETLEAMLATAHKKQAELLFNVYSQ